MSGIRLDGVVVAKKVKESVKKAIAHLKTEGVEPCLATVLVGDDAASATYVHNKHLACSEVGITTRDHRLHHPLQPRRSIASRVRSFLVLLLRFAFSFL